jgi:ATP-binding protein involved in chromosome partitioning
MTSFSSADILKALSHVDDPDLGKDIVTLGMVKSLNFDESKISFDVELTTPACPMKDAIEKACRTAITHFLGEEIEVNIRMTAQTTSSTSTPLIPGVKNVIAVASGKGGVGKSSISSWLALSLNKMGAKVGLLDGDMYGPSIPTMLGLTEYKPNSISKGGKDIMVPAEVNGIKVFSIGFLADPKQAIVWRGPMLSKAFKQFLSDVDWGDLDYLIIDLPPGTGDIQLTICQTLPLTGSVIVTTPQQVSLADAQRAISMFDIEGIKSPVIGVVENMAYFAPEEDPSKKYFIFGKGGGRKLAEENNVKFLGEVPLNIGVREMADEGSLSENDSKVQFFNEIAGNIVREVSIVNSQSDNNQSNE